MLCGKWDVHWRLLYVARCQGCGDHRSAVVDEPRCAADSHLSSLCQITGRLSLLTGVVVTHSTHLSHVIVVLMRFNINQTASKGSTYLRAAAFLLSWPLTRWPRNSKAIWTFWKCTFTPKMKLLCWGIRNSVEEDVRMASEENMKIVLKVKGQGQMSPIFIHF